MPHPIDLLLDPISLAVIGLYAALMLWAALHPARNLPTIKGRRARGRRVCPLRAVKPWRGTAAY